MNQYDKPWLGQVCEHLDDEVRHMDGHTASRLNRLRQAALDQALSDRGQRRWRRPIYALASCAAVALAISLMWRVPETPIAPPLPTVDDFELLAGAEELEMIENLEFYAWLEQQSLDG